MLKLDVALAPFKFFNSHCLLTKGVLVIQVLHTLDSPDNIKTFENKAFGDNLRMKKQSGGEKMSLRIPQEMNGEYPLTYNKIPFTYQFTETEEFIITKCRLGLWRKRAKNN